ncbi:MAG: FKBP-type peptidyl-prolyl cis-trans isomerase [Muribaculaceae bacterium]|nr:FKBP-type peptidyl-prolyl cis-trans isomerase [Muribaculaceae bacterium]
MIKRTFCAIIALVAAMSSLSPNVFADSDNNDNAIVAVFVASNLKLAVDDAIATFIRSGIDCDTAVVKKLVLEELAKPYNLEEHRRANAVIENKMALNIANMSQKLLSDATTHSNTTTLPDGLVFEIISEGIGRNPLLSDTVAIKYSGFLPDGSLFDRIGDADEPLSAPVTELTAGMAEALTMMKCGGQYRVTIPSDLAYGKEGIPGIIPPDCALQFEIQLLEIK